MPDPSRNRYPQAAVFSCALLLVASALRGQAGIVLGSYPDIVGLASSYNLDDGFRTVIVARANGEIRELFYKTNGGQLSTNVGNSVIAQIPDVVAVAAFYAADDQFRIVLAATRDGKLHEVFYNPSKGRGESVISEYGSIRALAGYFDPTTNDRVAVVLTGGPTPEIRHLTYRSTGRSQGFLGDASTAVVAICASRWSPFPGANRRVVTSTADGNFFERDFWPNGNTAKATSGQEGVGGVTSIACGKSGYVGADQQGIFGSWFLPLPEPRVQLIAIDAFSSDHIVVARADGRIELYIKP